MHSYELNEANQKLLLEAYEFNKQNKLPQTIEQLDKILQTEKNYIIISNIYYFKARALTELNRQEDALTLIEDGLRHNANNSFLLYLKAKILAWRDYSSLPFDQAIKFFQEAMRLSEQAQINFQESNQALQYITNKIPDVDLSDFVPTKNDMRFLESNIRNMLGPLLVLQNTKDGFEAVKKDFGLVGDTFFSKIKTIEKQVETERTRTIELLGLFTAIIAFIFSTIHFATNLKTISEVMIAIIGMGAALLVFLLTLHMVLDDTARTKPLKYLLGGLVGVLVLLFVYAAITDSRDKNVQSKGPKAYIEEPRGSNKEPKASIAEPKVNNKEQKPSTAETK